MTPVQERVESILAVPPAGGAGLLIMGYSLGEVVLWLNFTYVALLLAHKIYRIWRDDVKGGTNGSTT